MWVILVATSPAERRISRETAREHTLWIFSAARASLDGLLTAAVARSLCPVKNRGRVAAAEDSGGTRISRMMVEGGARVAASFVAGGFADEIWLYRGPVKIGADGVAAFDGLPLTAVTQSPHYRVRATEVLGQDTLIIYERS